MDGGFKRWRDWQLCNVTCVLFSHSAALPSLYRACPFATQVPRAELQIGWNDFLWAKDLMSRNALWLPSLVNHKSEDEGINE
jgi:hypothetical protein